MSGPPAPSSPDLLTARPTVKRRLTPPGRPAAHPAPLQIDRTRLPGEGFGEWEESPTPMIAKGSADLAFGV
eukprot:3388184-Pyramimonas_sp.AAC.1